MEDDEAVVAVRRAKMVSAATIPDFIAVWLPLILGTFRKPAEQPISAPPARGHRQKFESMGGREQVNG